MFLSAVDSFQGILGTIIGANMGSGVRIVLVVDVESIIYHSICCRAQCIIV